MGCISARSKRTVKRMGPGREAHRFRETKYDAGNHTFAVEFRFAIRTHLSGNAAKLAYAFHFAK